MNRQSQQPTPCVSPTPNTSAPHAAGDSHFEPDAAVERLTRAFAAIVGNTPAGACVGGASLAVWQEGKQLLSLHGGEATAGRAWTASTPCLIWSASKGVAAACTLHVLQESRIPLDTAVAKLWPEFAAAGKDKITLAPGRPRGDRPEGPVDHRS